MKPRTQNPKPGTRLTNSQNGLIHVAKKQLGLSDEEYRDILSVHGGGAGSSRDLSQEQFKMVMKHFERCGFKQLYKPRSDEDHRLEACATKAPDLRSLPREKQGVMALIGLTLGKLEKSWDYARGIARRMIGQERLEWCSKEELQKVLAALVYASRQDAKAPRGRRKAHAGVI